jgi:prepilin-type processing-associated H-X9-DG protein
MNYEAQYRTLPPGMQWNLRRSAAYGWAVPLLPFLEQHSLFSRLDLTMDPGANCPATGEELPVFWCPSDISQPRFELFAELGSVGDSGSEALLGEFPTANYFGVWGVSEPDEAEEHDPVTVGEGAFIDTRPVRLAEFERGLSQTLLVGERTMARVPATWFAVDARGEDAACRLLGNAATRPNCDACDECEFASRHPGGANFLWGDGRCSFVSENISREIYRDSAVRAAHDDHSPGD